jgi:hypothetical protein
MLQTAANSSGTRSAPGRPAGNGPHLTSGRWAHRQRSIDVPWRTAVGELGAVVRRACFTGGRPLSAVVVFVIAQPASTDTRQRSTGLVPVVGGCT